MKKLFAIFLILVLAATVWGFAPMNLTGDTESCDLTASCGDGTENSQPYPGLFILALLVIGVILILAAIFIGLPVWLRIAFGVISIIMLTLAVKSFGGF